MFWVAAKVLTVFWVLGYNGIWPASWPCPILARWWLYNVIEGTMPRNQARCWHISVICSQICKNNIKWEFPLLFLVVKKVGTRAQATLQVKGPGASEFFNSMMPQLLCPLHCMCLFQNSFQMSHDEILRVFSVWPASLSKQNPFLLVMSLLIGIDRIGDISEETWRQCLFLFF